MTGGGWSPAPHFRAESLLAECRAGRRGDGIESEDELKTVLDELREIEGQVLRGDPLPVYDGRRRLVMGRIALDWNYSKLASKVMDVCNLYRAL